MLFVRCSCCVNFKYRYVSCKWWINHILPGFYISCLVSTKSRIDFYCSHLKLIFLMSSFLRSDLELIRSWAWSRNSTSVASSVFMVFNSFTAWSTSESWINHGIQVIILIMSASIAIPATIYLSQSIGVSVNRKRGFFSSCISVLSQSSSPQSISELFIHRTCPAHSKPRHILTLDASSWISSISTIFQAWWLSPITNFCICNFLWNTPIPCSFRYGSRVRCSRDFKRFPCTVWK